MAAAPDPAFMRRAIALALGGRGRVEPNPIVGAVVVRDGRVVGEGRHESWGGPHAEVNALAAAGEAARGAELHVSLEPCSTRGKTPPCTEAILRAGIRRVVFAARDPNPAHADRARAILEQGGVEVVSGFLAEEAEPLLADFRRHLAYDRPVVVAKWAASLDGRIATRHGESRWITGEEARRLAHEERARSEAVMIGIGTLLHDDPLLDARLVSGRAPRPIVLDSALATPLSARLLRERAPLLCAAEGRFEPARRAALEDAGAEILVLPSDARGRVDLALLLPELLARGIRRLMVEGGAIVLGSLFAAHLVDLVQHFSAPILIGDAEARPAIAGPALDALAGAVRLERLEVRSLGPDLFQSFRVLPPVEATTGKE